MRLSVEGLNNGDAGASTIPHARTIYDCAAQVVRREVSIDPALIPLGTCCNMVAVRGNRAEVLWASHELPDWTKTCALWYNDLRRSK